MSVDENKAFIDYELCVFCQENKQEKLIDPNNLMDRPKIKTTYINVGRILSGYRNNGKLIKYTHLNDISDYSEEFEKLGAKWHKLCRLKFTEEKLKKMKTSAAPCSDLNENVAPASELSEFVCLFCKKEDIPTNMHVCSTISLAKKIEPMNTNDEHLAFIGKRYHLNCLSKFNKDIQRQESPVQSESAFDEVIRYFNDWLDYKTNKSILYLKDIHELYRSHLKGLNYGNDVNRTRLKDKILQKYPQIKIMKKGTEVIFYRLNDAESALLEAATINDQNHDMLLLHIAKIIRESIFNFNTQNALGSQEDSVPDLLLVLVTMILYGSDTSSQNDPNTQSALSISQLIKFNAVKHHTKGKHERHNILQETPLAVYTGTLIYAETRKKNLVETFKKLGLSISYDRVMEIFTQRGNTATQIYRESGVVCPTHLRKNNFVTCAVDNIDHNPSSTTSKGSFHGTAISVNTHLTQPVPDEPHLEITRTARTNSTKMQELPDSYRIVKSIFLDESNIKVPDLKQNETPSGKTTYVLEAEETETSWLKAVSDVISKGTSCENISWSAYHADRLKNVPVQIGKSGMLPLFTEAAHSPAMICHTMDIASKVTEHLNPGQTPVLACDEPLFAIAKKSQWAFPNKYGEDKLIVMFGALHIEMNLMKCIGSYLEGTEWDLIIAEAGIALPGTAESFLKGNNLTKARHAHQVTAAALFILQNESFQDSVREGYKGSFEDWIDQRSKENVNFKFWSDILEFQKIILLFTRSIRERNFGLYIETLESLMPYFFALDHIHYSRWLSVHIRDMKNLKTTNPKVFDEFMKGHFVFNKTANPFSSMAIDQNHEQHNAVLKGDGGIIGITENPNALLRWMVAGPEISRVLRDFEAKYIMSTRSTHLHHDQTKSIQKRFIIHVDTLVKCLRENGSPFDDECPEPISLKSKIIFGFESRLSIDLAKKTGETQYQEFMKTRLIERTVNIMDPIKMNRFPIFKTVDKKNSSKSATKIKLLKNDCQLFSRLFIATQNRSGDLNDFFKHENQSFPPSLSDDGFIRSCSTTKDILTCLENCCNRLQHDLSPDITCALIDGPSIVNFVRTETSATFSEYVEKNFIPYIMHHCENQQRIDVVFDCYKASSLQASVRCRKATGRRQLVYSHLRLPKNWNNFLRLDENRTALFNFLSNEIVAKSTDQNKTIICTVNDLAISNKYIDVSRISPTDHEEACSRLMLHLSDAAENNHSKVIIHTDNVDVVCLAVRAIGTIQNLRELWIAFGSGKNFRYIPVHEIAAALNTRRSSVLPLIHSFSGVSLVSSFYGRGKKTVWDVWMSEDDYEFTNCFERIIEANICTDNDLKIMQKFVVRLYDRTSCLESVNDARKYLFTKKNRLMEHLPPTLHALIEHIKRAIYQGSLIWCRSTKSKLDLPNPEVYGFKKKNENYVVHWTSLQQVATVCKELRRCTCKKGCKQNCKCKEASLNCTSLCNCDNIHI